MFQPEAWQCGSALCFGVVFYNGFHVIKYKIHNLRGPKGEFSFKNQWNLFQVAFKQESPAQSLVKVTVSTNSLYSFCFIYHVIILWHTPIKCMHDRRCSENIFHQYCDFRLNVIVRPIKIKYSVSEFSAQTSSYDCWL